MTRYYAVCGGEYGPPRSSREVAEGDLRILRWLIGGSGYVATTSN